MSTLLSVIILPIICEWWLLQWKHWLTLELDSIFHHWLDTFVVCVSPLSLLKAVLLNFQDYYYYFFFNCIATLFIYLFIYFWLCWVFGSCEGFLQLRQVGATLHRGAGTALHRCARAPHHRGPSRRGAQAPDAQAQQLWPTGPAAPRHVGSSQTRARTRVPCISRQILNHCATREALQDYL